jgi:arylsulfatase A
MDRGDKPLRLTLAAAGISLKTLLSSPRTAMPSLRLLVLALLASVSVHHAVAVPENASQAGAKPNIVFILADDLGYGDVQFLNPERGKIPTPGLDRLADQGMRFMDAHSNSSVCSPTRYGLLTGRYAWRTRLQRGVLFGLSAPLIAEERLTVGQLLQQQGYHTACIGKWHLGMQWAAEATDKPDIIGMPVDYDQPILHGPTARGFNYYYGITASLDIPPYIWIENDRTIGKATAIKGFMREGPAEPDFEAVDVLPTLVTKARDYIAERAAPAKQGEPFFLYLPLSSPHTPILPTAEWVGKSGLNAYGDFVMQTDAAISAVLAALDEHGLAENTLVIFTSDNGCWNTGQVDIKGLEEQGHYPSAQFRGYKMDIWEGGHRVPFIARWPGKIAAGSSSDRLVSTTDLIATCADLLSVSLPENAGEDSISFLPILLGHPSESGRRAMVQHSMFGQFAIRKDQWKLAFCAGSGGPTAPRDGPALENGLPPIQLYDLTTDPGETNNLQAQYPEIVAELTELIERYVAAGRSTPGTPQANDGPVRLVIPGK